ncbi:transcriptional regulator, TetR family [Catenulispora acidiphila DSM 44928]|uniref:Transcriptional regulator, TetR family n=1 Tax=Catenulispora acidiphila (strain DSM 44928 / JCM 14897 / NBRC 102108 / NRRL B-24433 / ID139908) TaxID=479433 RepID=C7PZI5_CATAD|nr:TetR/AcrR family transcriptional regulator [Catenulispora acidiphila]ACU71642.1 transcriptional regulator, TetR family [Catenulispora acidiphila DSM 44928]
MSTENVDETAATRSIWERMALSPPVHRPVLTHALIAEAALRIADADGLEAVSMRRLATELGVSSMTCYRYVSGKDDVIELMLDTVRGGMLLDEDELAEPGEPGESAGRAEPAGSSHWRRVLRASAMRFRGVILMHPWMTDLPGRILFAPTPAFLAVAEQNLAAFDGLGLTAAQITDITGAVTAYTRAGTHDEVTRERLRAPEGWTSPRDAKDANTDRLAWLLANGDYPRYERSLHEGAPRHDEQARFEFGLDCLLDGIAARLSR